MWTLVLPLMKKAGGWIVVLILVIVVLRMLGFRFFRRSEYIRRSGRVVEVHDGDTITFRSRLRRRTLDLEGVDAPEIDQPHGEEAREWVRGRLSRRASFGIKRKNRAVCVVEMDDGRELNAELVRAGLAWSRSKDYDDLHEAAREAGVGLWGDRKPTPPWLWVGDKE